MGLDGAAIKEKADREKRERAKRIEKEIQKDKLGAAKQANKAAKHTELTAWQADNRKRSQEVLESRQQDALSSDCICKDCGYGGRPIKIIKGSDGIEISLWLAGVLITLLSVFRGFFILIVPFVYSLWRRTGKKGCPKCKGHIVDKDSPMGR